MTGGKDRKRVIAEEPLGPERVDTEPIGSRVKNVERDWLVTEIRYALGGMNYFSGDREPRGYFLSVSPETRCADTWTDGSVHTSRRFTMFSGIKTLLKPAARFSVQELAAIAAPPELIAKLRATVLAKKDAA